MSEEQPKPKRKKTRVRLLKRGQVLAKTYEVGRPFAQGAFAVLYDAIRLDDSLPVVVKALKRNAADVDPSAVARFVREAAVVARIDHPHIVRVLNFGKTRDEIFYIVLEKLNGQPLIKAMFDGVVPPEATHGVLAQLLEGLKVAHERGLVHRDLKPSNIFVCEPDHQSAYGKPEGDLVKILDFGFVKVLTDGGALATKLTMDGQVVGTPGYMAPESLTTGAVSPQVDLYAIGVIGHELITGEQAFEGEGFQRAMNQLENDPKPPDKPLGDHPVYGVIKKLMARNPKKRYRTAEDALKDLRALETAPEEQHFLSEKMDFAG